MSDIESRFTPVSGFCPHPEYWHSPDSEATEDEVSLFIGSLVKLLQPEYVVETGTYHGHTALEIIAALHDNRHGFLDTIEKDGEQYKAATDFIAKHWGNFSNARLLNTNSMEFTPTANIDFAFLDSWQEGRYLEFHRFYEGGWLKKGAIVAVHDTAPHHQVWKGILKLEEEGLVKGINFHTPRGLYVGQVQ